MKKFISFILIILMCTLCLVSCGKQEETSSSLPSESVSKTEAPADIKDQFASKENLSACVPFAFDAAAAMGNYDTPLFLKEMESLVNVEVLSFKQNGVNADAKVKVTSPKLISAINMVGNQEFKSEDALNKALADALKDADILETELDMSFTYDGEKWTPDITDEFFNAYYGGILDLRQELFTEFAGGEN